MSASRKWFLPAGLVLCVAGLTITTSVASATHPRPKSAKTITASLTPAYSQCTAPTHTHGPPLAFPSCNPPTQTSIAVTVGTPDANGAAANSTGFTKISVLVGTPGPPDDSDVRLTSSLTDVRCKPNVATCGSPIPGGPDYTGELQGNATIRLTDHDNAPAPGGGTEPATMVDIPFPVNIPCVATASNAIGATCTVDTSANSVVPGVVKDQRRDLVEVQQLFVTDGGPDGVVSTSPNTLFAVQGIFIP
jgi:hypothetical protein